MKEDIDFNSTLFSFSIKEGGERERVRQREDTIDTHICLYIRIYILLHVLYIFYVYDYTYKSLYVYKK